jgi:hypothetical protein
MERQVVEMDQEEMRLLGEVVAFLDDDPNGDWRGL